MSIDGKNLNPKIFAVQDDSNTQFARDRLVKEMDTNQEDMIDEHEVFDMIRFIEDPEHPNTLEELAVVSLD